MNGRHAIDSRTTKTSPTPVVHLQRKCACGGGGAGGGNCPECEKKKRLSRLPSGGSASSSGTIPAAVTRSLSSPGNSLDAGTRGYFEPRFGHDFSRVRVHADSQAEEAAASVGARAFTVGRHVVFGRGEYAPGGPAGREILAHELTHVLQQDFAEPSGPIEVGAPGSAVEREADETAHEITRDAAANGPGNSHDAARSSLGLQRLGANPTCTKAEADGIHQAIFDANSWALKALKQLDESPPSARVVASLRRNFGTTYGVVENIELIRGRLAAGRGAMLRIPYSCDTAGATDLCQKQHCGWSVPGDNAATICTNPTSTLDLGAVFAADCMLHESMHAAMSFMTVDVYKKDATFPGVGTEPLLNSQSYVELAKDLS